MLEVIKEGSDRLRREIWRFNVITSLSDDIRVTLSSYREEKRETVRHKYRPTKNKYESFRRNDSLALSPEQVPMPPDVVESAKQQLINNIVFEVSEYNLGDDSHVK